MRFKHSNTLVFAKNRAKISLSGFLLPLDLGDKVELLEDATVIVDLMSLSEIERYQNLDEDARRRVADLIVREKLVEVVGYSTYKVDFNYGVAGLPCVILDAIYSQSLIYVHNAIEAFTQEIENVSLFDQMVGVITHYLHIPFSEASQYPVNEVIRLYAICFRSFPGIVDLRPEDLLSEE